MTSSLSFVDNNFIFFYFTDSDCSDNYLFIFAIQILEKNVSSDEMFDELFLFGAEPTCFIELKLCSIIELSENFFGNADPSLWMTLFDLLLIVELFDFIKALIFCIGVDECSGFVLLFLFILGEPVDGVVEGICGSFGG